MEVKVIKNRTVWNNLIKNLEGNNFLQSYNWAEFQNSFGKKVWCLGVYENNSLEMACLLIEEKFPYLSKSVLYVPFGPLFREGLIRKKEVLDVFLKWVKSLAKKEKSVLLRIEPISPLPKSFRKELKRVQPHKTLILDLRREEEEIFRNFNTRTRYNIRLADRKGVKVKLLESYHPSFYKLLEKTAKTNNFHYFPEEHYKKLFNFNDNDFKAVLCLAEYRKKIIAGKILIFYGKTVTSLHGASDRAYRSLKAPALVQWIAIQEAKRKGFYYYDFWGFDEKKWPGFSYFKKGFNGKMLEYPKGVEIVFNKKWYFLYYIFRKVCRK